MTTWKPTTASTSRPEVEWMRTPLRDRAIEFIHKTALELAGDRVKRAEVMISVMPDEEDSETLDLVLTLDTDWDFIGKLQLDIIERACDWDKGWSHEEWHDYSKRVNFCLLPVIL